MPIPMPPVWKLMGELKPLLTGPMVPIPPMLGPDGKAEEMVPLGPELSERLFRDVMLFRRLLVRSFA